MERARKKNRGLYRVSASQISESENLSGYLNLFCVVRGDMSGTHKSAISVSRRDGWVLRRSSMPGGVEISHPTPGLLKKDDHTRDVSYIDCRMTLGERQPLQVMFTEYANDHDL